MVQENVQEKIVEPTHDEERFAERAPPVAVEKPEAVHSHV
jgi:hypothetical protein